MTYLSGRGVALALCLGFLMATGPGPQNFVSQAATGSPEQSGLQIKVAVAGPGEVDLFWTAPGDDGQTGRAAGYDLRCLPASSGPIDTDAEWNISVQCIGEPLPSISGRRDSMTESGLIPGAGYYFCIKAYDEAGNYSGLSNSPLAIAGANNVPQTPTLLSPANGATVQDYSPTLDWSDIAGADYYQVQVDNNSTFASPERTAQPTGSSYTVTPDLTAGTWYWRARVNVDSVFSGWTAEWRVVVADITLPVISNVRATNITSGGATITWITNEAATSQINYGLTSIYGSGTALDQTLVTAHSQAIAGLSSNTTYHYRVRSRDGAGNEAVSPDFTFTTTPSTQIRNLARGITPIVGGTFPGYSVGPITNGIIAPRGGTSTTWASDQSVNPHWVEINFGASRNVQRVVIYWAYNAYQRAWMTSSQYRIQRWNGSSFVNIAIVNNTTRDSAITTNFSPVSTSRIRIYQPTNMGPQGYNQIMWLTEIEAWGFDTAPIMAGIPGDVNGSGHLDGRDLVYLVNYLKGGAPPKFDISTADVDGSGAIDKNDVEYLMRYFHGSGPAPVGTRNDISSLEPESRNQDATFDQ